ncbi:hypothetical protein CE91St44_34690 [Oscillospiraceae bacterium]|nr:hypothetical protein CE91St44_34690 [Oscillospiraceae bacterium]
MGARNISAGKGGNTAMNATLTIQEKLKDLRVEHSLTLEQNVEKDISLACM